MKVKSESVIALLVANAKSSHALVKQVKYAKVKAQSEWIGISSSLGSNNLTMSGCVLSLIAIRDGLRGLRWISQRNHYYVFFVSLATSDLDSCPLLVFSLSFYSKSNLFSPYYSTNSLTLSESIYLSNLFSPL